MKPINCRISAMTSTSLLLAFCASLATAAAQSLPLPFVEQFRPPQLDSAWTQALSPGGSLVLKDGGLSFDAPLHARAHVERAAGIETITLSATIIRWGALYLVWD